LSNKVKKGVILCLLCNNSLAKEKNKEMCNLDKYYSKESDTNQNSNQRDNCCSICAFFPPNLVYEKSAKVCEKNGKFFCRFFIIF